MNTDDRHDDNREGEDQISDGLDLTEEESALAGQADKEGDDAGTDAGKGEGDDAGADAGKDGDAAKGDDAGSGDDAGDEGKGDDADGGAAAPAPAPAADAGKGDAEDDPSQFRDQRASDPEPEAPKDFDAEFKALEKKYDDGDLDTAEYNQKMREITREEARFVAQHEGWKQRQEAVATDEQHGFAKVAGAWEKDNQDFMSNPLRANAMQQAIQQIDRETEGKLTPEALMQRAEKAAFEAFGYSKPGSGAGAPAPAPAPAADPADKDKVRQAVSDRQNKDKAPPDLERAPAAAPVDSRGNATYSALDNADISELEDAMANMTDAERERFLADSPGSNATGG